MTPHPELSTRAITLYFSAREEAEEEEAETESEEAAEEAEEEEAEAEGGEKAEDEEKACGITSLGGRSASVAR